MKNGFSSYHHPTIVTIPLPLSFPASSPLPSSFPSPSFSFLCFHAGENQSSDISHHQSSAISHQSSAISHQSSIISHQSPVIIFLETLSPHHPHLHYPPRPQTPLPLSDCASVPNDDRQRWVMTSLRLARRVAPRPQTSMVDGVTGVGGAGWLRTRVGLREVRS